MIVYTPTYMFQQEMFSSFIIVYTPTYMFQQESLVALCRVYTHIHVPVGKFSSFIIVYTPTYMFQQEMFSSFIIVYTPTYMFQQECLVALLSCIHPHTCSSRKVQQLYYRVYTHIHVPVGKFSSFIIVCTPTIHSRKVLYTHIHVPVLYYRVYMFQQESLVALLSCIHPHTCSSRNVQQLYYRVYTHIHVPVGMFSSFIIVYTPTYMFQYESLVALLYLYDLMTNIHLERKQLVVVIIISFTS